MVFMWEASPLSTDNDVTYTPPLSGYGTAGVNYPIINAADPSDFTTSIHAWGTGFLRFM